MSKLISYGNVQMDLKDCIWNKALIVSVFLFSEILNRASGYRWEIKDKCCK